MTQVVQFETRYPAGKDPVDMVLIAPQGSAFERTQTWYRVNSLKPRDGLTKATADSDADEAILARWEIIGPAYEAWKEGSELPETGTPLSAWSGLSRQQVEFLNRMSIRTVEDVAAMDDKSLEACRWPDARKMPKLAADWLAGSDMAAAVEERNALLERIAVMEEMLAEKQAEKPRRGRPPKAKTEAA